MLTIMARLQETLDPICPTVSIRVGTIGVSGSVVFFPQEGATQQQIQNAQAAIDSFDWSDNATIAFEEAKEPLLADLKASAAAGIADINTYLAIADAATNVQVRSEVKAIDQRQKKIIQALNRLLQKMSG